MFTGTLDRVIGLADAALTPHGVDRYLELVDATWSTRDVRARVVAVRHPTPDAVTLTLRPNRNWRGFVAGQHTQLTVAIGGVRHTRCYSMAGSQHDRSGTIELTVKAHPEGFVSRHLVAHARPGQVVDLTPAAGDFTLPDVRPSRVLLVSGGSGITPVISMLRTLCDEGYDRPVTFLHYALTARSMLYATQVAMLSAAHPNVRVVRVFTDEPGVGDLDGFLTAAQLDAADPGWRDAEAYVCGPAPLMDATAEVFAGAGRADHLHREAFTLTVPAGTGGGSALRLVSSGRELVDDGRPVLLQAEDAGLRPMSGCRMGICHTCTRPLRAGTVRDAVTGTTTTGEVGGDVEIRICVSVPVGDVEIDL